MEQNQIDKIKEDISIFFDNMTVSLLDIKAEVSYEEDKKSEDGSKKEIINIELRVEEPQVLIGQGGQTLFEIQRLLRMLLNKKNQAHFFVNLDINNYKKQKTDYLIDIAKDAADYVRDTKREKILYPMPPYERRIIHAELADKEGITTESRGEGSERCIVIKPD